MHNKFNSSRVLFVYHEFTYGGASKSLAFWLNALASTGAEVSVVTYKSLKPPHYKIPHNVKVIGPSSIINLPGLRRLNDIFTVAKAALIVRPHVVIGLMSVNSFYGYIIGRLSGAKVIVSERGCPTREFGWFIHLKHWAMNRADGAVFQTKGAMAFYSQRLQEKSIVIPNPAISSLRHRDFDDRTAEFLFVGRFELRQKRHDVLLNALKILVKDKPNAKVNFIGDGPDLDRVKKMADQFGLSGNTSFLGVIDNVPEILEKYKYFVITSDYEGIPNTLIEAMIAGMACISTDCEPGGAREFINTGHNGLLVQRGNAFEIAQAMDLLLDDEELSNRLGKNARDILYRYKSEDVASKIISYVSNYI
jgi:GalNAc-alpha-(1->4)-GalNAc-alpha-(1->3)-diNAcBac-PP-undecaprenol alpha-1,4-N-acetyl-D-galactosaminyltransferase